MPHYMNPFEFVPLPAVGPKPLSSENHNHLDGPRYEGCIRYSITPLTPLHITGKTTRNDRCYAKKSFYECHGKKMIPGSEVRGMLHSFIETLTGSDIGPISRGHEGQSKIKQYEKNKNGRYIGFSVSSPDDDRFNAHRSETFTVPGGGLRFKYGKNVPVNVLPKGFGRHQVNDAATFFFGHVDDQEEGQAKAGRLFFEDIILPDNHPLTMKKAWDLNSDAVMGSPNPRANTAWYFKNGTAFIRTLPRQEIWTVCAGQVRGRKFYYHQKPDWCHDHYGEWQAWMPDMRPYDVESIAAGLDNTIRGGKIYFMDMPEKMLHLLMYSLVFKKDDRDMKHKLGALKPYGYGSIEIKLDNVTIREMDKPFDLFRTWSPASAKTIYDPRAHRYLKRIMHFPSDEADMANHRFIYPVYRQESKGVHLAREEMGFARAAKVQAGQALTPQNCQKMTMYFDHYQKTSSNFQAVMGGPDYRHIDNA